MGRIRKFYVNRLSTLLPQESAQAALERAATLASKFQLPATFVLALVHAETRQSLGITRNFPRLFFCDAGLGGLARWLRGAGYEAHWNPECDDPAAIREAQRLHATLLTTDTLMMERGVLRDHLVPAVLLPSSLTCEEQLIVLVKELALPLRESRCMKCGGELRRVDKHAVAARIPPKTALWLDEYFLCQRCDQLFWRGTHWQKITRALSELSRSFPVSAASEGE